MDEYEEEQPLDTQQTEQESLGGELKIQKESEHQQARRFEEDF